jgi:hypothetical protein
MSDAPRVSDARIEDAIRRQAGAHTPVRFTQSLSTLDVLEDLMDSRARIRELEAALHDCVQGLAALEDIFRSTQLDQPIPSVHDSYIIAGKAHDHAKRLLEAGASRGTPESAPPPRRDGENEAASGDSAARARGVSRQPDLAGSGLDAQAATPSLPEDCTEGENPSTYFNALKPRAPLGEGPPQ